VDVTPGVPTGAPPLDLIIAGAVVLVATYVGIRSLWNRH